MQETCHGTLGGHGPQVENSCSGLSFPRALTSLPVTPWPLKLSAAVSSLRLVTTCISYFPSSVMNLTTDAD